jgi:hypothetical protein
MSIKNLGLATIDVNKSLKGDDSPTRKSFMFAATIAMNQYFRSILAGKTDSPPTEKYRFEVNEETLARYGIEDTSMFGARIVPMKSGLPKEHIAYGADTD